MLIQQRRETATVQHVDWNPADEAWAPWEDKEGCVPEDMCLRAKRAVKAAMEEMITDGGDEQEVEKKVIA